jgi:hypothetical protein
LISGNVVALASGTALALNRRDRTRRRLLASP